MSEGAGPGVTVPTDADRASRPNPSQYVAAALEDLVVVGLLALLGYGMLLRQGGSFGGFAINAVG